MGLAVIHSIQNDRHVLFLVSSCLVPVMVVVFSLFPYYIQKVGNIKLHSTQSVRKSLDRFSFFAMWQFESVFWLAHPVRYA